MMEQQQQQQQQGMINEEQGGSGKNTSSSSFLCRQSSTRWTPTSDQIRILKDLYYNNGVRSPTAEQIQRISAKLRQYGKIEGKNVFYWFQNHKARERQKKRFTAEIPMHRPANHSWKSVDDHPIYNYTTNFSNIYSSSSSAGNVVGSSSASSTAGLVNVGSYVYGSVAMEESFRECSITAGGNQKFAWNGVDTYSSPYPFLERKRYISNGTDQTLDAEEEEAPPPEIETLPLFPMHGEVKHDFFNGRYHRADDAFTAAGSRASLELTLNSYAAAGFN